MITTQLRRQRVQWLLLLVLSLGLAVSAGLRLSSYGVQLALITGCALCVAASTLATAGHLVDAWSNTTHRCGAAGCAFTVTVRGVDAAENRRWQEIAAAHPTHTA